MNDDRISPDGGSNQNASSAGDDHQPTPPTDPSAGLTEEEAQRRLAADGPNDVPEKASHPLLRFAGKFWGLSAWLIEMIAALSFALHKQADFAVALALLVANAILSFVQEQRASSAVEALRQKLRVVARVLRNSTWQTIAAHDLARGDIVRLRTGDFVPADVRLAAGSLRVDQSALTGESRQIDKQDGDLLYSGSIVRDGEATAVVTATGARTYFGRTTELVASAHPKLHVEEVISQVVRWLLLIVGTLVAVAVVVSLLEGQNLVEILPLALVLLMSAIPVALPVMFTVSMAVGSIELAREGVLVTRLSAADDAANMDTLCADKTGTLTMNRLALAGTLPQPGYREDEVIRSAALASNESDQDAIDLAFLKAARDRGLLSGAEVTRAFEPFSAATRRTAATVEVDNRRYSVTKGALRTIAELCHLDKAAEDALEATALTAAGKGYRALAVARAETDGPWQFLGMALLYDAPRPDSARLIADLAALGVGTKLLTGDALPVAREVAKIFGLANITRMPKRETGLSAELIDSSDGFAEVFPEDKFAVVEMLQQAGRVVGMTGDGVNDAPALRQAEVGIAVSGATDVAKSAASVVLTTEGLTGIVALVRNGRAIYQRIVTWIINKVCSALLKAGFVVAALLLTGRFVISALGMVLLVFLTDFVKIALATDNVRPSKSPETWRIAPLVWISVFIGMLMVLEALAVLALGWRWFGLADHPGRLQTFSFEILLYLSLFSILSFRERRAFWKSRPSRIFALSILADAGLGVAIGLLGLAEMHPLSTIQLMALIGASLVISLGINDPIKTWLMSRLPSGA